MAYILLIILGNYAYAKWLSTKVPGGKMNWDYWMTGFYYFRFKRGKFAVLYDNNIKKPLAAPKKKATKIKLFHTAVKHPMFHDKDLELCYQPPTPEAYVVNLKTISPEEGEICIE